MRAFLWTLVATCLVGCQSQAPFAGHPPSPQRAQAADSSDEGSKQEIAELRRRVAELESANAGAKRQPSAPPQAASGPLDSPKAKAAVPEADWRVRENWRRLRTGMTYDEVRAFFGPPISVSDAGFFLVWVYDSLLYSNVQFDKESGTVTGWTAPR